MKKEKIYSINGEDGWCDLEDIYDIIESDFDNDEIKVIYEGDKIEVNHEDLISARCVVEDMQDRAYDISEYGEEYLVGLKDKDFESLDKVLKEWFDTVAEQPRFFYVENIKDIPFKVKE